LSSKFYNEPAEALAQKYLSTSFEQVHQSSSKFLPAIIKNPNARISGITYSRSIIIRFSSYFWALLKTEQQRFFAEANIALLGLNPDNTSIDDLFEALVMQRGRLKEMKQLREW
jgi:hypothetical protein